MGKIKILFLCTGNSCRSQMAEGWCKHFHHDQIDSYSAGVEVHGMNQRAIQVMQEAGVDLHGHHSKLVNDLLDKSFDFVITVCDHAHESCPVFPGKTKLIHVGFRDPPHLTKKLTDETKILNIYRGVRDEIRDFIISLPDFLRS